MSHLELARFLPLPAPRLDEAAALVELQDARVAIRTGRVALDDEDLSVAADGHVVRLIQQTRSTALVPIALLTLAADRQQRLPLRAHLDDDVSADVGDPEISVTVDLQSVRPREETLAIRSDVLAGS